MYKDYRALEEHPVAATTVTAVIHCRTRHIPYQTRHVTGELLFVSDINPRNFLFLVL